MKENSGTKYLKSLAQRIAVVRKEVSTISDQFDHRHANLRGAEAALMEAERLIRVEIK